MAKYVYFFQRGKAEGRATMKNILGGKGANLAEMCRIGIPVPPGFTISAEVCKFYYDNKKYPPGLNKEIKKNLKKLEKVTGKIFGDSNNPLLISVRSGAAVSMPGMMDTILNLGLNDKSVQGLIRLTQNPRFAWDSYRRFIQMFAEVVMGFPHNIFEQEPISDSALGVEELKELVTQFKKVYKKLTKKEFPQDPQQQLKKAIDAVLNSWNNERAIAYREINNIKGLLGTAVNIQSMVFGNMGSDSGTGVGFTRNPSTGDNHLYGEFLMNAQGEDVVAGIRTPLPLYTLKKKNKKAYQELQNIRKKLERHYKDMQDFEFTIEKGKLYMLQTRAGKRTAQAGIKIAIQMAKEKLITKEQAIMRIQPNQLDHILHPMFDAKEEKKAKIFSKAGLPASPGAGVGQVVFTAQRAEQWAKQGKNVILCRPETSPEDIRGMNSAKGILTTRGGLTSHAAVVARGMGKCCIVGAGDIVINEQKKQMHNSSGLIIKEGDWISLNGNKNTVYIGKIKLVPPKVSGDFQTLMKWSDDIRKLGVRANADTPQDAKTAVEFGAEGIGLCRTEHMFFKGKRIVSFRKMIIAAYEGKSSKKYLHRYSKALQELLPLQRKDFEHIYKVLNGKPCTIRLLDPPLHEFLPHDNKGQKELASAMKINVDKIKEIIQDLKEFNPMLGHRGCRLGITYPEITKIQTQAIVEAGINVYKKGIKPKPEIMVPLVGNVKELELQKKIITETIDEIKKKKKIKKLPFDVKIGTMIEVPRAAITADEIARAGEFFSFGTNDLTQMTCAFSRDDAGKFLGDYIDAGIYEKNPFQTIDVKGVGKLMKMAVVLGRKTRKDLKLGICGEHGGDPHSIKFCHKIGLTYVSCSPFRVPIARLVAAQAAIEEKKDGCRN